MTLGLVVFLILTILIPYINFSIGGSINPKILNKRPISVAHRGASKLAPENTIQSFALALNQNIDIIELDIHLSKDDSIVVIHDNNLKRTAGIDEYVENLTYSELRKINIAKKISNDNINYIIPTLDEVLKLVNGSKKVLIEIKWPKEGIYNNIVDKTLECIRSNKAETWTIIQSFDTKYLVQVTSKAPDIECHQLVFGVSNILPIYFDRSIKFGQFVPVNGISSVNIYYIYANENFVNKMHSRGLDVMVFTINEKEKMNKALSFNIDGIISDNASIINE